MIFLKNSKCQHIYCEVFKASFFIYFGCTPEYFLLHSKKIAKDINLDLSNFSPSNQGKALSNIRKGIFIIWTRDKNIFSLIHETGHVISELLKSRGIPHNEYTEEIYCYYQEWLCFKVLGRYKWPRKS